MKHVAIASLVFSLSIVTTSVVHAGKKVRVGKRISSRQLVSMDRIDHSAWDQLLNKYVNNKGQVNYRGLKKNARDVGKLDSFLNSLSTASTSMAASKQSKLAFWINAYNAVTIKGILREYPTLSIRNHTPILYGYHIWQDLLLNVGGKDYSLEEIEHDVLRNMDEPRVHFAIVCASHSCPRLLNQAYTQEKLEEQLVLNTKNFFANSENFRYESRRKRFYVSTIMKWFADDFGNSQAKRLRAIARYLPNKASQQAAQQNSVRVSYLGYDWSLNDWRRR